MRSFTKSFARGAVAASLLGGIAGLPLPLRLAAQQRPAGTPPRLVSGPGEIRGRLVDAASGQPVAGGSITVRRAGPDTSFAGGAIPRPDGSFRVDGLVPGRYSVRVRVLGFAPLVRGDVAITAAEPAVDLGALSLAQAATRLAQQQVTADRDAVVLAPDRNVYSTKNMPTASGGTAVDVLRNVPSVEVDGSNKVSLRGNENVVVQINGRTSPLRGEQLGTFLAQLPANAVKHVEIATNPSAKDDPEGTAGIINIVLDQEAEVGLSGGITAGTGTTGLVNVSGNVGRQAGKLTTFLAYNVFRDHRVLSGSSSRVNLAVPTPAFVESDLEGSMQPLSQNVTLRSEYRVTERDALSIDALYAGGRFERANTSFYSDLDTDRSVIGRFDQLNDMVSRNATQDYTLAFRRTAGQGPQAALATTFSTELRFTDNHFTNDADLLSVLRQADATTGSSAPPAERDLTKGHFPSWSLQADWAHPFGARTKLEAGLKSTLRQTTNDFSAAYYDSTASGYVDAPSRAAAFAYHEGINAGYLLLSRQFGKLSTQTGLRLEDAVTRFALPDAPAGTPTTSRSHYGSAFPSAILSYNLTDARLAKVSYSRRVSRPNPFQLSPIVVREDARHAFHGNPGLRPEYTDAFELTLQETHGWGSLQLNPYVRRTAHAVRYLQQIDTSGVQISTFDNVASTLTVGGDVNTTVRHGPLTFLGGGSVYRYRSDAANLAGDLSTHAVIWSPRANVTWKLSPKLDVQTFANYRSAFATEGGSQRAFVFTNLALRRKLWGELGSATLRVADPFNLAKFGSLTENASVVELNERRFGMRGVFFTVSRSFGQQLRLRPRPQPDVDPSAQAQPTPGGP